MLMRSSPLHRGIAPLSRQDGVVLLIALVVLIAMTLAGIALTRSVDTTNVIAGNLAFQQSALHSANSGIEQAIDWLETNNTGTNLHSNIYSSGYAAVRQDPSSSQSWDAFFTNVLQTAGQVVTLAPDAAGNTTTYAIQRLCNSSGSPTSVGTGCAVSPSVSGSCGGGSMGTDAPELLCISQVYYRITARVAGPRNTVSYVQAIIAL